MRHLVWFLVMAGLASTQATAADGSSSAARQQNRQPRNGLIATLTLGKTSDLRKGQAEFVFLIENRGPDTVCIDGRMYWPGNIELWAKLPSGRVERVTRLRARMPRIAREDVVTLQMGCIYGVRFSFDAKAAPDIIPELKKPAKGTYSFWVEYDGEAFADRNCLAVSLKSNQVHLDGWRSSESPPQSQKRISESIAAAAEGTTPRQESRL